MPGGTEALLVARNQEGNHGTLAFTLGSTGLQLIIMWTSGLNCDHYANTLAVGITNSPNSDKFRCTNFSGKASETPVMEPVCQGGTPPKKLVK